MSASTSITVKNVTHGALIDELRLFIKATTTKTNITSVELTKSCLFLLKHLPASRSAALHYLKSIFDSAAFNHIVRLEKELSTGKLPPANEYDEWMINDIYTLLINFVTTNGEAWAPIISTWSLELLGEISSHYAGRAHINGLNESLQLWMTCRSTKTLIDITTQCLACLMHSNTEACISALLDTSVKHSPHFDWVVAHVGSCFPQTVIERVLFCGLKDYCESKSYRQGIESPKMKSVVGIVGHLATSHPQSIQKALLDLFKSCLNDEKETLPQNEIYRRATVPFLIQIFVLSDTMLNAISDKIKDHVTVHTITRLYNMTNDWFKFFGSMDVLQEILVILIMKCAKGGEHIIELLLNCISLSKRNKESRRKYEDISNWTRELLECVLEEVDYKVRFHSANHTMPAVFLNSLIYDIDYIYQLLLSDDELTAQTAARLIIYIGVVNAPLLIQALSFLLQNAKQPPHLAYLVRILNNELTSKNESPYAEKGGHFSIVLQHILDKDFVRMKGCTTASEYEKFEQMWSNILLLLRWEQSNIFMLKSKCISKGIEYNLTELTGIFRNKVLSSKCSHMLCEVLDLLDIPNANRFQMPVQVTLNYVHGAVNYFFLCCDETDELLRMRGFKQARSILKKLCLHSKISRNLALRQLLEKALFSKDAVLFGAKLKPEEENAEAVELITENKKISKTIPLSKHSSVYNGGKIGAGKRKSINDYRLPVDLVTDNSGQLIAAIKEACAQHGDLDMMLESLTLISLTLVQLVSPDVMYNGLPWLEEEFAKVTIERDLLIRRLFNNVPLLWDLLNLVAQHRPALCYCSVLLRALTATLIHQWTSMGGQSKSTDTEHYKDLMGTTIAVLDVMALGQLLPAPLSDVRDILPYLNSQEIVSILRECIWCYMRDNVPSPALFEKDQNGLMWRDPKHTRPDDVYTKTLRTIMQRNIKTVGHLYSRMFIVTPKG